jgi:hypothetical protein
LGDNAGVDATRRPADGEFSTSAATDIFEAAFPGYADFGNQSLQCWRTTLCLPLCKPAVKAGTLSSRRFQATGT